MGRLQKLRDAAVLHIYDSLDSISSGAGTGEISRLDLLNIISANARTAEAAAVLDDLLMNGLIHQTTAIADENEGFFKITGLLIDEVDRLKAEGDAAGKLSSALKQAMSFKIFRDELLVELAKVEHKDGPGYFDLKTIADDADLPYKEGWVSKAAEWHDANGLIKAGFTLGGGIDENCEASLTADGEVYVEEYLSEMVNPERTYSSSQDAENATAYLEPKINGKTFRVAVEAGSEERVAELAQSLSKRVDEVAGALGQVGDTRLLVIGGLSLLDEISQENEALKRQVQEPNVVPASDRVVRRSDNEQYWFNSIEGAKDLHDAMVASNDHGNLDEDEFDQKLCEVRALQVLLDSPQVQWDVLEKFAEKTVKYLAVRFADNAIGHAATALLSFLGGLLAGAS